MNNVYMTVILPRENIPGKTFLTKFYKINTQKDKGGINVSA